MLGLISTTFSFEDFPLSTGLSTILSKYHANGGIPTLLVKFS